MAAIVEARYEGQHLVLNQPLDLPEGQQVRVTIVPIGSPAGQQIVAGWHASGVIGAWAHRKPKSTSTRWARQLRRKASQECVRRQGAGTVHDGAILARGAHDSP
jgi:hypothetical protein